MAAARRHEVDVCLEIGSRRVFAAALDWPGWCRSGPDEDEALESLAVYAPRYEPVVNLAGVAPPPAAPEFVVRERLQGSATTDFGAPGARAAHDETPLSAPEAERLAALVDAAWQILNDVAAVSPEALRKGPRGGGRDRDAMLAHVVDAETAYARKIGIKIRVDAGDAESVAQMRKAIIEHLAQARSAMPLAERGWPARYAARRVAWHTLDHAWEMEDRREVLI